VKRLTATRTPASSNAARDRFGTIFAREFRLEPSVFTHVTVLLSFAEWSDEGTDETGAAEHLRPESPAPTGRRPLPLHT